MSRKRWTPIWQCGAPLCCYSMLISFTFVFTEQDKDFRLRCKENANATDLSNHLILLTKREEKSLSSCNSASGKE